MKTPIDPIRSGIMRSVKSENTQPELMVRSVLHRLGYRFRLHRKDLPGRPDIVFPGRRKIIFVHGCFWHGHDCARGTRIPKNNREYWTAKIARNKERDTLHRSTLEALGWHVLTIWECQCVTSHELSQVLNGFLEQCLPTESSKERDGRLLQVFPPSERSRAHYI